MYLIQLHDSIVTTMSASLEAASQHSSSRDSESSTGFRSFWKKSYKTGGTQNVQFVQQNPGNRRSMHAFRTHLLAVIKYLANASTQNPAG